MKERACTQPPEARSTLVLIILMLFCPKALIKLQRLQPKRASATSHLLDRSEDAAEQGGATLLVATTAGVLYSYTMELLAGPRSPSFTFDHKCHLLAREQDP